MSMLPRAATPRPARTFDSILDVLDPGGERVEERSGVIVPCPAHDDQHPSLAVTLTDEGRVLLYCRAGCETSAVLQAAGLLPADLFDVEGSPLTRTVDVDDDDDDAAAAIDAAARGFHHELLTGLDQGDPRALEVAGYLERRCGVTRVDVERLQLGKAWVAGDLRAVVPFLDPATDRLRNWQGRAVHDNGPRYYGPAGARWGTGFLPAAAPSEALLVVEGVTDALTASVAGLDTLLVAGAGRRGPREVEAILTAAAGRPVVIVGDADRAGETLATALVEQLADRAATYRLTLPPGVGKDLTDWRANDADFVTQLRVSVHMVLNGPRITSAASTPHLRSVGRDETRSPVSAAAGRPVTPTVVEGDLDTDPERVSHGQLRMAHRLAHYAAGHLLYVAPIGWHVWDGKRWAEDKRSEATATVVRMLRAAAAEAVRGDPALAADVRACERDTGIRGVLSIAKALDPLRATVDDMDANPWLLNTANGTLDLRTLRLRAHDPADRLTKVTRARFDPTADGERWDSFLTEVIPDPDERDFVQRYVGMALLGTVRDHVLAIFTGEGRNGKSVLNEAVKYALGDYALSVRPDVIMARRSDAHPTELMDLRGARLAIMSESRQGAPLDQEKMKLLTGGDTIRARRLFQDSVEFEPSHSLIMVTNHLPQVAGDDPAVWARLRVVPFTVSFAGREDVDLPTKLRHAADRDRILTWAVEGLERYLRDGLGTAAAVQAATAAYQRESDPISRFVDDACEIDRYASVPVADLYAAYVSWSREDGTPAVSKKALVQTLQRHGFSTRRTKSTRLLTGLRLNEDGLTYAGVIGGLTAPLSGTVEGQR